MAELARIERFHLLAAESWLESDNCELAKRELQMISHRMQVHPDVLQVRYDLCAQAEQWEAAANLAQAMCQLTPGSSLGWSRLAEALHRMQRTQQAWDVLSSVIDKFPNEAQLNYQLARYGCQLGDLRAAWKYLERAIQLGNIAGEKAIPLADANLRPLWERMGQGNVAAD